MKKVLSCLLAVSLSTATVCIANAHDHVVESEKQAKSTVEFRQALLKLVRSNMGPLGAMAKGQIPYDTAVMQTNALRIEQLGMMMEDYFAPDTRKFDIKTDALPKIWDNFEDFTAKSNDLVVAAQNLQEVVAGGDEGMYREAIGKLGGTCKACHDDYKKD